MSFTVISAGVCQHLGDNISQTLQSALLIPPSCARSHLTCLSLVLHNPCIVPDFSISVTAPACIHTPYAPAEQTPNVLVWGASSNQAAQTAPGSPRSPWCASLRCFLYFLWVL